MSIEKEPRYEVLPEVNLEIRDLGNDHRMLEFDSQDPKACEAYIAAIADVLSRMWPDDVEMHPAHVKEILIVGHVFDGEIKGGFFSFPLSLHDTFIEENDKRLLDKIHGKAREIYLQIL